MEMFFSAFASESTSSQNFFGHPDLQRCPFLRNINGPTSFSFSSALPVAARGGKGPIFEDGLGFDSAFRLFHGRDGIVPLSGKSYVREEKHGESLESKPQPAPQFNPLAAKAATISLSAFGPFGFFFNGNGKGKKQNKKPNNLDMSNLKKGGNSPSHEALSDEWLENGQCPLARSYRAMRGVLPLVAKALQPPPGMKLKCPPAVVAARAALARTALVKSLRPQPLPAKMLAIALLGMAANIPLGVWREHTQKFSPQWFAAVHAAVPFIAMLRKSVVMPKTAMAFTIAASIIGQTIGSRAERIRLRAAAAETFARSAPQAVMYLSKNAHCGDTEGKPWDPLRLKAPGSGGSSPPASAASVCF